jgi:hypothetical protein
METENKTSKWLREVANDNAAQTKVCAKNTVELASHSAGLALALPISIVCTQLSAGMTVVHGVAAAGSYAAAEVVDAYDVVEDNLSDAWDWVCRQFESELESKLDKDLEPVVELKQ